MIEPLDYSIQLETVRSGFDGQTCWVHARAGAVADRPGVVVLTTQRLLLSGSDVFFAVNEFRTVDGGRNWTGPVEHRDTMGRRMEPGGVQSCICDFTPAWHAPSGTLLGTGHVARYQGDALLEGPRPRETAYSVYDADARTWSPWACVAMPTDERFFSSGAGSTQRVDLPDGDILLPIYFKARGDACYRTTVMRCAFDGRELSYVAHGDELAVPDPRGLCEPSLTRFGERYYLTMRNDVRGYVAGSPDGLKFDDLCPWSFDDGQELGSYNTQQHWLTHSDGLFLVYTRRGAQNDHVFRHRAPLFAAQVDPERLCVVRDTERIIAPERGARLGNFGVFKLNGSESWVVVTEWMQPVGCEKYGSDNSVYVARIRWREPNRSARRMT